MCWGTHAHEIFTLLWQSDKLRQMSHLAPWHSHHKGRRTNCKCLLSQQKQPSRSEGHPFPHSGWPGDRAQGSSRSLAIQSRNGVFRLSRPLKSLPHPGTALPSTSIIIGVIILSNGPLEACAFPGCCAFSLMGFKNKQQKVAKVKQYLELAAVSKRAKRQKEQNGAT
uniref:Uncharacterized protein n=1 Tax=Mus musculus TaxID=10090 RepID=Q3ULU0_MOUSE|nr:unnamed protein product [Mus musculus]